jgi:hypothetical protein
MPRRRHNSERDVVGAEIFVRLGDGFLEISPAALPGSPARFYRGTRPPTCPGEPPLIVASAGATPMVEPRSPRPRKTPQGSAPALAMHSTAPDLPRPEEGRSLRTAYCAKTPPTATRLGGSTEAAHRVSRGIQSNCLIGIHRLTIR